MRVVRHVNHSVTVGTYAFALGYRRFPPYTHVYLYRAKTGQLEKRVTRSSLWLFLTIQSDSKFRRSHASAHRRLVTVSPTKQRPLENQETLVSCTRPLAQETSPVFPLRRRYVRYRQQDVVRQLQEKGAGSLPPAMPLSDMIVPQHFL